jgi:hypothetical protein
MLARRFNAMNGHEAPGEFYGSDYSDLTHALNLGNAKAVDAALQTLVATKKPQELASYFVHFGDRPFTGNHMTEGRFLETLNPEQKATYEKAVDDRHRLAQAGMKAVEGYFAKTEPEGTGHALAEQAAQKLDIGEGVYSIAQKLKSAAPEDREGMLTQLAAHPAIFKAVANHIRGVTEDLEPSEESIAALGVENGARAKFLKEHITSLPAEDREAFLTRMVEKKLLTGKVLQQIRGE